MYWSTLYVASWSFVYCGVQIPTESYSVVGVCTCGNGAKPYLIFGLSVWNPAASHCPPNVIGTLPAANSDCTFAASYPGGATDPFLIAAVSFSTPSLYLSSASAFVGWLTLSVNGAPPAETEYMLIVNGPSGPVSWSATRPYF